MKRKATFCCDTSCDMYEDYYTNQSGRGTAVFVGTRNQRGRGLGSVLSGLFGRIILPFFRSNCRTIASKAIKTGLEVADDVAQGNSFKESAERYKRSCRKYKLAVVVTMTSLHDNGFRPRAVVRMSQV